MLLLGLTLKKLVNWFDRHELLFYLGIMFLVLLVFFIITITDWKFFKKGENVEWIYYALGISITFVIALIAYRQSKEALRQSRTNYLLRVDERWSSNEVIKARLVIHKLYLNAQKQVSKIHRHESKYITPIIAKGIMELHDKEENAKDFIYLLNFLDFLETIGYLHSEKSISTDEVRELLANSIIYFYEIFSDYIDYRRKTKDPAFYQHFEKLKDSLLNKCTPKCTQRTYEEI